MLPTGDPDIEESAVDWISMTPEQRNALKFVESCENGLVISNVELVGGLIHRTATQEQYTNTSDFERLTELGLLVQHREGLRATFLLTDQGRALLLQHKQALAEESRNTETQSTD